eukprot:GHVU01000525.1.p1 GENE.GHVU01000525.1~~GHVU01000525.1.p1  ORF type:complete len:226 (-),score=40.35 GHVU01000525.1:47-628(-)
MRNRTKLLEQLLSASPRGRGGAPTVFGATLRGLRNAFNRKRRGGEGAAMAIDRVSHRRDGDGEQAKGGTGGNSDGAGVDEGDPANPSIVIHFDTPKYPSVKSFESAERSRKCIEEPNFFQNLKAVVTQSLSTFRRPAERVRRRPPAAAAIRFQRWSVSSPDGTDSLRPAAGLACYGRRTAAATPTEARVQEHV